MPIQVGDTIDVSRHHNADGQLYCPGTPWGVRCLKFFPGAALPTRISGSGVATRKLALEHAAKHGAEEGMVAIVFRRRDGRVIAVFANPLTPTLEANSVLA